MSLNNYLKTSTYFCESMFLSFFVILYSSLYAPFLLSIKIDVVVRVFFEFSLLSFFCLGSLKDSRLDKNIIFLLIVIAFLIFLNVPETRYVLSAFNKLLFFVFLYSWLKIKRLNFVSLNKVYVFFWFVLSIFAVLSIFCYFISDGFFTSNSKSFLSHDVYYYFSNPVLGNIIPKKFWDYILPRYSGFVFEPAQLSFFFCLNFFISKYLIENSKTRLWFQLFSFIGGVVTFSVSFFVIFPICFIVDILFKKTKNLLPVKIIILLFLFVFIFLFFKDFDFLKYTSFGDRFDRLKIAFSLIDNFSIKTFFFGYGMNYLTNHKLEGISFGFFNILVLRGFITLAIVMLFFKKILNHSITLFTVIFLYNFVIETPWYPMSWIGLALVLSKIYYTNSKKPVETN